MKSKNILYISPEPPVNYSGGGISILYCIMELVKSYSVYFLCLPNEPHRKFSEAILPDGVKYFKIVQRDVTSRPLRILLLIKSIIEHKPYHVVKNESKEINYELQELSKKYKFDACIIEHSYMSEYGFKLKLPKILNMQNIESDYYKKESLLASSFFKRLLWWLESRLYANWEIKILKYFDQVTFITEFDYKKMLLLAGMEFVNKMAILPRGIICHRHNKQELMKSKNIIFVGSMAYDPNIDAVIYFAYKIFPKIRIKIPDATFTIVGNNPHKQVLDLQRIMGVEVTGFVDDVTPYYKRAAVVVIPMRKGGGVKMKLLEAVGCGVPVVSTTFGAEGVNLVENEEILIADDPDQFADKCINLLTNADKCRDISIKAMRKANKYYSWNKTGKILFNIVEKAIDGNNIKESS